MATGYAPRLKDDSRDNIRGQDMSEQHAFNEEEWAWLYEETMPAEFNVEITADGEITCDPPKVTIARDMIGLIRVSLQDHSKKGYEFVPLIFEDDHRKVCTQRWLGPVEIMIVDDNRRMEGETEEIKFSVLVRSREANKALYLDPRVVNE